MVKKPNIGAKITLEGEKEYKQAISDVGKSMKMLKSELRAVSAEYEGNANSLDALRAKNELYTKQQAEQEKKLALLRGALEDVTKKYGENSKQAQYWQTQINNAYSDLSKINRELSQNGKYMKEAEKSTDQTAKSIDEYGKKVKEASKETGLFGDMLKANLVSDAITSGVRKLADVMGDAIEQSIGLASNLEEVQNVVDVTFGGDSGKIDDWSQSLARAYGISELNGKQFAGTMGAMLKSMQLTSGEALTMSQSLVQLSGDMASFYNIDVADAFAKIRSGISGETEPLKQLGINMNVANLEAYALSEGLNAVYSEMTQAEQAALRYNYLMKTTADAQGDFARNSDSLANQQRIFDLQREEMLTRLGNAIMPSVTRATAKLNEAMSEMDDNFSEAAEAISEVVVDGLVWIVDNIDVVIAGLKGVGAAMITKKAVDGIDYAIKAYNALTTATEAATTAQMAFNTVSKANAIGLIASVVIGLGTALVSYAESANEATESTEELISKYDELSESIERSREEREKSKKSIEDEYGAIQTLSEELYKLADKESKTNSEKKQMVSLVEQLNKYMPELNLFIDEQTGLLSKEREEVDKLIESGLKYAEFKAAQEDLKRIASEKHRLELELSNMLDRKTPLDEQMKEQTEAWQKILDLEDKGIVWLTKSEKEFYETNKNVVYELSRTAKELSGLNEDIGKAEKQVTVLGEEWNKTTKFIGDYSSINGATDALNKYSNTYEEILDKQMKAEIGTVEGRVKAVNGIYAEAEKELTKRLRAEERALEKSQKAQVEVIEKAQEKELSALQKSHDKKLELINKEYLEKMKNIDEDRYNELKVVQDQIDAIDRQQEAENRALKLREEAEKKAEFQSRIENATTIEERLAAQEDLLKFEEGLARDRLKEERALQKDVLKLQKDTINDSYDAKIESLKQEQRKEEEKAKDQYDKEKKAINERYKLKVEALKEEQELEKETLRDKQGEYRKHLQEQKTLAVENAKKIYEEDLKEFKLNSALKYDEYKAQQDKILELQRRHSNSLNMPATLKAASFTGLGGSQFDNAVRNYPQTIDYDEMGSVVEDAMTNALKKLNLTLNLNDKNFGTIVESKVNRMVR